MRNSYSPQCIYLLIPVYLCQYRLLNISFMLCLIIYNYHYFTVPDLAIGSSFKLVPVPFSNGIIFCFLAFQDIPGLYSISPGPVLERSPGFFYYRVVYRSKFKALDMLKYYQSVIASKALSDDRARKYVSILINAYVHIFCT